MVYCWLYVDRETNFGGHAGLAAQCSSEPGACLPGEPGVLPASTPTPAAAITPAPAAKPAATASRGTTVINFRPSGATGQEIEGYCWVRSLAVSRPGAWRCMAGNQIHDPCFSNTDNDTSVICVADPTGEGKGIKMNLAKPLPVQESVPQGQRAWVLELADGSKCAFLQGATGGIGGKRLNYGCAGGWYILGDPDPGPVWKADKVRLAPGRMEAQESMQVDIKTVWM